MYFEASNSTHFCLIPLQVVRQKLWLYFIIKDIEYFDHSKIHEILSFLDIYFFQCMLN
jgi:hypothetical protein